MNWELALVGPDRVRTFYFTAEAPASADAPTSRLSEQRARNRVIEYFEQIG
jgi:hypothetical protein